MILLSYPAMDQVPPTFFGELFTFLLAVISPGHGAGRAKSRTGKEFPVGASESLMQNSLTMIGVPRDGNISINFAKGKE